MSETNKSVLVILGKGFEELEAVGPIDVLRRANVTVTLASTEPSLTVQGRNSMLLVADVLLDAVAHQSFDAVIVPGGPAVAALRQDERVLSLLRRHASAAKILGAICAAPLVLAEAGLLEGRRYTGHASIAPSLPALVTTQAVVVDGRLLTSRGAGTAVHFGLALVEALVGKATADQIAESIHHQRRWAD